MRSLERAATGEDPIDADAELRVQPDRQGLGQALAAELPVGSGGWTRADDVLELCADLRGAVEDYPFGDEVTVFKVGGKMFALVMLEGEPGRVNLKCDPDLAIELRAQVPRSRTVPAITMSKRHWNTVELDGSIDDERVREMIDHSYDLVLSKLPRRVRDEIPRDLMFHGQSRLGTR